jgi:hypothetical protein
MCCLVNKGQTSVKYNNIKNQSSKLLPFFADCGEKNMLIIMYLKYLILDYSKPFVKPGITPIHQIVHTTIQANFQSQSDGHQFKTRLN